MLSYIEAAEPVTIELTAALEEALGVPAGRLQDQLALHEKGAAFEQVQRLKDLLEESPNASQEEVRKSLPARLPYYRMKLVQYGKEGNEQGVGAHRDGGWVSIDSDAHRCSTALTIKAILSITHTDHSPGDRRSTRLASRGPRRHMARCPTARLVHPGQLRPTTGASEQRPDQRSHPSREHKTIPTQPNQHTLLFDAKHASRPETNFNRRNVNHGTE